LIADDPKDTLVIAGADLSHVGQAFGDRRALDGEYLAEVKQRDEFVLDHVSQNRAEEFLAAFACENNPTQVCSVGCMYLLMKTLPQARAGVVDYHQAVDQPSQTGVTCAAAVFRKA
jgi:predicted class III extradiol MEMO1 family dioxygenase